MTTRRAQTNDATGPWLPTDLDLPPSVESAAHIRLPTDLDLPYDDDTPMDSDRHAAQIELLKECLRLFWSDRPDWFVGGNMFVYFSNEQLRTRDFRGPDLFVVLGVPKRERRSWVVWDEGKAPDVVIELLSDTTAAVDRGEKKRIYQEQLRVPEYYWYHPFTEEFAGWLLQDGEYVPLAPEANGRIVSPALGLALRTWHGEYAGITATWLRWETLDGHLLPTGEERAYRLDRELADKDALLEDALRRVAELEARLARSEPDSNQPPA